MFSGVCPCICVQGHFLPEGLAHLPLEVSHLSLADPEHPTATLDFDWCYRIRRAVLMVLAFVGWHVQSFLILHL